MLFRSDKCKDIFILSIKLLPANGRGRPSEEILLTPLCVKKLCMMSKTPNADKIRDYFFLIFDLLFLNYDSYQYLLKE